MGECRVSVVSVVRLTWMPERGDLTLDSQQATVRWPQWFASPFHVTELASAVHWQKSPTGFELRADHIKVNDGNLKLTGNFNVTKPTNGHAQLNVASKFSLARLTQINHYLPKQHMSPKLRAWLAQAFAGGTVSNGVLLLHGPIGQFPFKQKQGYFKASLNVSDALFHYKPHWPSLNHINAIVTFNDANLLINADHGEVMGTQLSDMIGQIPDITHPQLDVNGHAKGTLTQGIRFLTQTPLHFAKQMKGWKTTGQARTDLSLTIPLVGREHHPARVVGTTHIQRGSLTMSAGLVPLTDMNGALTFRDKDLRTNDLQAKIFGGPVDINLYTDKNKAQQSVFVFTLGGHVTVDGLRQHFPLFILDNFKGTLAYRALLKVNDGDFQNGITLTAASDLQGVSGQLPPPYGKTTTMRYPFWLQMSDDKITVRYGELFSGVLRTIKQHHHTQVTAATLHFGKGMATLGANKGLLINGRLAKVNWQQWQPLLMQLKRAFVDQQPSIVKSVAFHRLMLNIDHFVFHHYSLKDLHLNVSLRDQGWQVGVDSATLAGQVMVPRNQRRPWVANLQRVYLPHLSAKQLHFHSLFAMDPGHLPIMHIRIGDLRYGTRQLGKAQLTIEPMKNGWHVKKLYLYAPLFRLSAQGAWYTSRHQSMSSLSGVLTTSRLGDLLNAWELTHVLVGGDGSVRFSLQWLGNFAQFNMQHVSGKVSLDFNNGRITHLSSAAESKIGLGRVLNLLSLQSLPDNVLSGLIHFGKKGFDFYKLKSNFQLAQGVASTSNLSLGGSVANVLMQGKINFVKRRYDLKLTVMPKVTSSLPLIVALAGGPLAGAIAWVANKLIAAPIIAHAAESVYHVTGPWQKPEIKKYQRAVRASQ